MRAVCSALWKESASRSPFSGPVQLSTPHTQINTQQIKQVIKQNMLVEQTRLLMLCVLNYLSRDEQYKLITFEQL